jgi:hypothetical protein
MRLLHSIRKHLHSNYNSLEQILECKDSLSFDGIYESVYNNREALAGKDILLFVMGDYIGGDNKFDIQHNPGENLLLESFCTMDQLLELKSDYGFRLAWHTKTHRDLTKLTTNEIADELETPSDDFEKIIAYPYGNFDERVIGVAQDLGYLDGYSVHQGNGQRFQRRRDYL